MKYSTLAEMLNVLCEKEKISVCIHCLSGVMDMPDLRVKTENKIHSARFCDIAPSTPRGYELCIRCKTIANIKAISGGKPFEGYCAYGLYEIARPVIEDGKTICIIYIGNIVRDREKSFAKAFRAAKTTGVDFELVKSEFESAQEAELCKRYSDIAELIDSYIRLLLRFCIADGHNSEYTD